MKKFVCLWLAFVLALWPSVTVWAQSGGNCSVFRSWITGDSLTAGDLSQSFTTTGVTNMTQACIDGISDTVAGMQTTTNPYASDTESLATSGAGEIQRLRYVIESFFGLANWYRVDSNLNFGGVGITKTGIDGAGTGAHVTAVGLHLWGGSQRFPSLTGRYIHTTGFFWPAAHHLAIAIDPAVETDKGGVETFRFHVQALTLHHTAAIRFWHSTGGSTATGHITALSVSRGLASVAGNEAAGRDTLLIGHAGTVMNLVGYGASHIALGSSSYLALGGHVAQVTAPVGNALYGMLAPKMWVKFDGQIGGVTVNDGFNVAGVTDVDTGDYRVRFLTNFANTNYACMGSTNSTGTVIIESYATTHVGVRTFNTADAPADVAAVNVVCFGRQ